LLERSLRELGKPRFVSIRGDVPTGPGGSEPLGTTGSPPLPKLIDNRRYLDSGPGTTVDELRERIRPLSLEVAAISADGETIEYAPILGIGDEVRLPEVWAKVKDKHLIHNHPRSTMLSWEDLEFAIDNDLKSITAVLNVGGDLRLERKGNEWPPLDQVKRAYSTGVHRAAEVAVSKKLKRDRFRELLVKEINGAFKAAFGSDAIQIDLQ